MHPDFAVRGKILARYAVQELGYRTLAVLSSTEPNGAAVAESFSSEARRLGGHIIAAESFPRQASDIRQQCMSIRRSALDAHPTISFAKRPSASEMEKFVRAGVERKRIDSLVSIGGNIAVTELLGPRGIAIADSLRIKLSSPTTESENLNEPITSIDAIFVGIDDAEEIGVIGSQLSYFNIKSQILGNNEWYDPDHLDAQRQYINGIIFASDTFIDPTDPAYIDFVNAYRRGGGKQSTKYTLIGYDVAKLVLACLGTGIGNRNALNEALFKTHGYKGVHSSVTLTRGRVNSRMHILQYSKGEVRKIGETTLND